MIQHPHCYHHGSLLFQQSLSLPLSPSVEPPHQHLLITVRQPQAFRPSYSNLVYMEGDVFYGVDLEKNGVEKAYSKLHSTPYRTPSFSFASKSNPSRGVGHCRWRRRSHHQRRGGTKGLRGRIARYEKTEE